MKFEIKKNEKGETDINIDLSIMPKCVLWNHNWGKWEDNVAFGTKGIKQKRYCLDCNKLQQRVRSLRLL